MCCSLICRKEDIRKFATKWISETAAAHPRSKLRVLRLKIKSVLLVIARRRIDILFVMPVPATIFVVVLATIIESLPRKVNDSITLPVLSSIPYFL
jgi:hypothetical protein